MRRRQLAAWSMLLGSVLVGSAPAAWSQGLGQFSEVVIFATNSAHLRQGTIVAKGDVVVNDFSPGPTLKPGAELGIDRNAALAGRAVADTITRDVGAVVAGPVVCNTGTGVVCGGLFLPVFGPGVVPPFQEAAFREQAPDVTVGAGQTLHLEASDYADVTVGAGGTLVFGCGIYNLGSVLAGASGRLQFSGRAELRILGRFEIGQGGFVGPAPGAAVGASGITLYVGGRNAGAGAPSSLSAAATFGQSSTVQANVYVPAGTFHLKQLSLATGAFLARDVLVERDSVITLASAFNPPPTADPQVVFTQGTTPLAITLTGSDPEGETLTFAILTGPAKGTLSGLTQLPPDRAAVTYTANQAGQADSFTFRVTDPNGGFDDAVVLINPVDDPVPPTPSGTVLGQDDALEAIFDTPLAIVLVGYADVEEEGAVGDLTFRIVSGPSSGILDPDPPAPSGPPGAVRRATTTYFPDAGFAGADGFVFEVCGDLDADGDTTDAGECDTATISITVDPFVPPEPPEAPPVQSRAVLTQIDTPVVIELAAATGGGSEEPGGGRPGLLAAPAAESGSNNPRGQALKATALTVGGGWTFFNDCGVGSPCPAGPFTFTVTGSAACVSVTDAFVKSDVYAVSEGGQTLGTTSPGFPDDATVQSDPDLAFADPEYSSGTFVVGTGPHAVDVTRVSSDLGGLAAAFLRVDSPGTAYCAELPNLTVTAFSAPATAERGEVIGDRIHVTLTNTGTVDIPAGTLAAIGFYVSTDALITTGDLLLVGGRENLASSAPDGLAVGASISDFLFAGASIPAGAPEGPVFLGVLADELEQLAESDETDNTAAQAIVIGAPKPDLVVTSLTHEPAAPGIETQIVFTAMVENAGEAPASASTLCFEIGYESCADPGTLFAVPALFLGETFEVERTAVLPAGAYQNTAIADFAGVVDESDEENNTAIDTLTVAPAGEGLFATVVALPQFGTLFDQTGLAITSLGPITGTRVTYVPATGSITPDAFQFTLTDAATGLTSLVARIDVLFAVVFDPCALVGRPPGCLPGL